MKNKVILAMLIFVCGIDTISAQVHDVSFVVSGLRHGYYNSKTDKYIECTPQQCAIVDAIREVYFNMVSKDSAKFESELLPVLTQNTEGDFYSNIPNVINDYRDINSNDSWYHMKFTISIDNLSSYCKQNGITCDLANQTLGAEMRWYKFMQRTTNLVYQNIYEELADYCLFDFEGNKANLYDYDLIVGEPYPSEREDFSVLPLNIVLKQNDNTHIFFNTFIEIMNAMSIPDSLADAIEAKGYKTYQYIIYKSAPLSKQKASDAQERYPYIYLDECPSVMNGRFYYPLHKDALNGIFERIYSLFTIYDNLTEKEEIFEEKYVYKTPYLTTQSMKYISDFAYDHYNKHYCDIWEMSDLGYTSYMDEYSGGDYYLKDYLGIILLAVTDSGDVVTRSRTFNILIPNDILMNLTYVKITNSAGLEGDIGPGAIFYEDPAWKGEGMPDAHPDPYIKWTYHEDLDVNGNILPWSLYNAEHNNDIPKRKDYGAIIHKSLLGR